MTRTKPQGELPTKASRLALPPTLNLERETGRVVFRPEVSTETADRWLREVSNWFGAERRPLSDWAHKVDLALAPRQAWDAGRLVAKRCRPKPHRALATGLGIARSRAEKAFEHALCFEQCGLGTPRAFAWMEVRPPGERTTFYLIAEHLPSRSVWLGCSDPGGKSERLDALAQAISILHGNGLRHRDLKMSNLYFEEGRAGFYDLESVRPMTPPLSPRVIVRDLGRLAASFLSEPAREAGIGPDDWRTFVETYLSAPDGNLARPGEATGVPIDAEQLSAQTLHWARRKARKNAKAKRPLA